MKKVIMMLVLLGCLAGMVYGQGNDLGMAQAQEVKLTPDQLRGAADVLELWVGSKLDRDYIVKSPVQGNFITIAYERVQFIGSKKFLVIILQRFNWVDGIAIWQTSNWVKI